VSTVYRGMFRNTIGQVTAVSSIVVYDKSKMAVDGNMAASKAEAEADIGREETTLPMGACHAGQ